MKEKHWEINPRVLFAFLTVGKYIILIYLRSEQSSNK